MWFYINENNKVEAISIRKTRKMDTSNQLSINDNRRF